MLFSSKNKKVYYSLSSAFIFLLLLQFNNCNSLKSQVLGSSSNTSSNLENTPVNPENPYVLQCILSSDGVKVSSLLEKSVISAGPVASKINSLDWTQDEDLIVTLDNACISQNNFTDSILQYVSPNEINLELPFTVYVIKKESVKNLKIFISTALESECLQSAEKNKKIKIHAEASDPRFQEQKHLSFIEATETNINSFLSYNSGLLYKTKVAVIDTGVDISNPDLIDQFARDSNSNIIGFNSTGQSSEFTDIDFHGTHVAGLIGAHYFNGINGSGVWGRNIEIYPIRAFEIDEDNEITASSSSVANAILWATSRNVDLINLSLGTTADSRTIKDAISFAISKNVTIVVAAGNDGNELNSSNPQYPAMYSTQFNGLITVSSIDATTQSLSSFSNYSSSYVDILSPGSNGTIGIGSTVPVLLTGNGSGFASKYKNSSNLFSPIHGTSMATPVVTGALAAAISLAKSKNVKFTNAQLETFITGEGSRKKPEYSTYAFRGNFLNLPVLIDFVTTKINEAIANGLPPPPIITISQQPVNKQAVIGEKIQISINVTGVSNPTYQWYQNNLKIIGATSSSLIFNQISENQAGRYYVEVTSGSTIQKSQETEIKVALKYCNK